MENFKKIETMKPLSKDALTKILNIFKDNDIELVDQICLNTIPDRPDDYMLGRGSLHYDWDNATIKGDREQYDVSEKPKKLQERDFTQLCSQFVGTDIERLYNYITSHFKVGRVRVMRSLPMRCLSWHHDNTNRLHYPLKTQPGCFMVIEDEIMHLEQDTWWWTNTTKFHTAFNGSKEDRIHLVVNLLKKDEEE